MYLVLGAVDLGCDDHLAAAPCQASMGFLRFEGTAAECQRDSDPNDMDESRWILPAFKLIDSRTQNLQIDNTPDPKLNFQPIAVPDVHVKTRNLGEHCPVPPTGVCHKGGLYWYFALPRAVLEAQARGFNSCLQKPALCNLQ